MVIYYGGTGLAMEKKLHHALVLQSFFSLYQRGKLSVKRLMTKSHRSKCIKLDSQQVFVLKNFNFLFAVWMVFLKRYNRDLSTYFRGSVEKVAVMRKEILWKVWWDPVLGSHFCLTTQPGLVKLKPHTTAVHHSLSLGFTENVRFC